MEELRGRVAVVTGAANGIGLAVSAAFVAEGMRVVLADLDADSLTAAVDGLAAGGAEVHGVPVDVTDPASVEALGAAVIDRFGALHVAVNNAGIVNGGRSWEIPLDEWERVIAVDLWGVIHGVRTFVPRILATGAEGHVVNTASLAAVTALPNLGPYTVAKHGVLGLSDVLRSELADMEAPIGVSVVMPGRTMSKMNPIGKYPAEGVAANVIDAIRRNRPYVFTDPEATKQVADRMHSIMAARDEVVSPDPRV